MFCIPYAIWVVCMGELLFEQHNIQDEKKKLCFIFLPDPRGAGLHLAFQFLFGQTERIDNLFMLII